MNARARSALRIAVLLAAAACSDTSGVTPGIVTLALVTPNANDGAVTVVLTGPGITSLASARSAYSVYWRVVSPTEARAIVVGDLNAGVMATATVADVNQIDAYHVEVLEVATRSDSVRTSTTGYAITLAGPH